MGFTSKPTSTEDLMTCHQHSLLVAAIMKRITLSAGTAALFSKEMDRHEAYLRGG
jgi:hypothetical protein